MHPGRAVTGSESERARRIMKEVYRALYLNGMPFIETSLESAEMIKYASNVFLAVKTVFIDEIAGLCEKTGANGPGWTYRAEAPPVTAVRASLKTRELSRQQYGPAVLRSPSRKR